MTASPPIPPVDLEAPPLCERLEEMASNRQEIADSMRSWEPKPGLTPRLIAKADGEAATLREAVQQIEALRAEGAELKRDEAVWEKKCDDDHAMIDRLTKEREAVIATIKPWARLKYEDVGSYSREGDSAQLNLVVVALDALLARIQGVTDNAG
jgi:hypothetical protein